MVQLIGVLNLTPDSFSDGGKFNEVPQAVKQAEQLFADGATWVDVGAESTRPGAQTVHPDAEWERLADFWQAVAAAKALNMEAFSLDTRNPATAQKFLDLGGRIINDVSGFKNPEMVALAARKQAVCIVNHFPGNSIDEVHEQKISSIESVKQDLLQTAHQLMAAGVGREKIILDPGIGFGKTPELNQGLLEFAALVPDWPALIGASKKRFLGAGRFEKATNVQAAQTAIKSGAAYLRVHNPAWYQNL